MDADTPSLTDDPQLTLSSEDLDSIAAPSLPFVGHWQSLISQTNWEKGKIIFQWRTELQSRGVSSRLYSDPAWSRLVGEVSPQHVGRLRRNWERFGEVFTDYAGLYWSHFFAALDWQDAEMWLEGAVQNDWSVSQMRYQRWETMGKLKEDQPQPVPQDSGSEEEGLRAATSNPATGETVYQDDGPAMQGPLREGPDFGDEPVSPRASHENGGDEFLGDRVDIDLILQGITDEIAAPFRQLRSALQKARHEDWASVKRMDLIALVNDLKMLLRKPPKPAVEPEAS